MGATATIRLRARVFRADVRTLHHSSFLGQVVGHFWRADLGYSSRAPKVQVPTGLQPGSATIEVTLQGEPSGKFAVQLQDFAPGIFTSTGTLGAISHASGNPVTLSDPAQPGEALSLLATGLGPTSPLIGTGVTAPSTPPFKTTTMPTISIDGQNATVQQAALQPGSIGKYEVFFTAPLNFQSGNHMLSLSIGGKTSNPVTLVTAGAALPNVNSVVNGASFGAGPVAPGSMASIFGANFGQPENRGLFPATSFQDLSVTFNGTAAPLFAVVPPAGQINVFVPSELSGSGVVNVRVTSSDGASQDFPVQLTPTAPGAFRISDPSKAIPNNAVVLFANTAWLVVPESLASALQIPQNCSDSKVNPASTCGEPARAGDLLLIFATGLGQATAGGTPSGAVLPTGSVAPASGNPVYETVETPSVTIGGIPAQVLFSGIAPGFAGLYQINVQVPQGAPIGDQLPLKISSANGASDTTTIAIRH
jgi:uncharacterized protein (TIGR03437 family)